MTGLDQDLTTPPDTPLCLRALPDAAPGEYVTPEVGDHVTRFGERPEGLPCKARSDLDSALELHPVEDQDGVAVLVAHVPQGSDPTPPPGACALRGARRCLLLTARGDPTLAP